MTIRKLAIAVLITGLAMTGLYGCEKNEGPAEKAGKAIDNTASDISESASDTMDAIEKKVKE